MTSFIEAIIVVLAWGQERPASLLLLSGPQRFRVTAPISLSATLVAGAQLLISKPARILRDRSNRLSLLRVVPTRYSPLRLRMAARFPITPTVFSALWLALDP